MNLKKWGVIEFSEQLNPQNNNPPEFNTDRFPIFSASIKASKKLNAFCSKDKNINNRFYHNPLEYTGLIHATINFSLAWDISNQIKSAEKDLNDFKKLITDEINSSVSEVAKKKKLEKGDKKSLLEKKMRMIYSPSSTLHADFLKYIEQYDVWVSGSTHISIARNAYASNMQNIEPKPKKPNDLYFRNESKKVGEHIKTVRNFISGDYKTLIGTGLTSTKNKTKRKKKTLEMDILSNMENTTAWKLSLKVIRKYHPQLDDELQPTTIETMLRIDFIQQWYSTMVSTIRQINGRLFTP